MMRGKRNAGGNITAAFGADLFAQGVTVVPNLLLRYYRALGLDERELCLLLQIMRLMISEGVPLPTASLLAAEMTLDEDEIKEMLVSLRDRGFLSIKHYYDEKEDKIKNTFGLEGLFLKISDLWAEEKMREHTRAEAIMEKRRQKAQEDERTALYQVFEGEFGTPLTQLQLEQIHKWLEEDGHSPEVVLEALRRAVLQGKRNFRYIDSILLEWKRNNLRTVEDINLFEANYRRRTRKGTRPAAEKDDGEREEKRRAIKLLYYN